MTEDIVRAYGYLPLGTRLKRIGERLQADTQRIMDDMGVPIQASQYPFLASLDRIGPLTIGELADAVGITQPGATRTLAQLIKLGVVKARQAPEDQRRKIITLTAKGQAIVDDGKANVWPRIEGAVRDLCEKLSGPLLEQLAAMEDGLAEKPLDRRGEAGGDTPPMKHILDRPAWSALTTRHAALSEGGDLARRYDPSIIPFAAARDDSEKSLKALGALAGPDESLVFVQADEIVLPPGLLPTLTATGVQMILKRTPPKVSDERILPLTDVDAPEMLELATLTRPGPFTLRAQALGEFFGVKDDGRLIAMAGERMKPDGFAEVSGVCTHPDFQGRGLGKLLSIFVTHRVLARGETPFLHAFATNTAAIALYESIGFELRTMMNVAMVRAEAAAAA